MKCECGRGLLAGDRKKGLCGRCGNLVPPRPLPPSAKFWKPQQVSAFKKGRVYIGSDVPIFNCMDCNRGEHARCDAEGKQFCECFRNNHKEKTNEFICPESDTGRGGIREGTPQKKKVRSGRATNQGASKPRRGSTSAGVQRGRQLAPQVQVDDEEEEFF